jgi:hypothetical protein
MDLRWVKYKHLDDCWDLINSNSNSIIGYIIPRESGVMNWVRAGVVQQMEFPDAAVDELKVIVEAMVRLEG